MNFELVKHQLLPFKLALKQIHLSLLRVFDFQNPLLALLLPQVLTLSLKFGISAYVDRLSSVIDVADERVFVLGPGLSVLLVQRLQVYNVLR